MKTRRTSFALLFALPLMAQIRQGAPDRTKPPASPPPRAYKLPPVTETNLANGLTVITARDNRFPLVTMRLVFLAGNKRDPQSLPGLAGLVAEMLTEGTTSRSFSQIAVELDSMGGVMDAATGADSLTVDASVLASNTTKMLDLLSDVARHPLFPEHELTLAKQNRKQNLQVQYSQPSYLANVAFRSAVFGDQPYAHVGPTLTSLDHMDRQEVTAFRDLYLVPNNATLILAGSLPPAVELTKSIEENFASWQPNKDVVPYTAPTPPPAKRQLLLVDRPGSVQADIRVGRVSGGYTDPMLFPLMAASLIEGGGPNSRLFLDIREKRGFAYDVHTENARLADSGTFSTVTEVRNEVVADALSGVIGDLDTIAKEPVTSQELSDAKAYASGVFLLGMEPQRGLADNLALMRVMNLPKDYLDTYTTRINSVEPDQILNAAKKYIAPENDVIVVVGDAAKLRPALERFGTFETVVPAR